MSDDADYRDFLRWQGKIEERVSGKASRTEMAEMLKHVSDMDQAVEQRTRDLMSANADNLRREMTSVVKIVERNGAEAKQIGRQLDDFVMRQERKDADRSAQLATIREHVETIANQKPERVNWLEWGRWGLIILFMIGAIITQDYKALFSLLRGG